MRKYLGMFFVSLAAVCLMGLAASCGNAEADPTRWTVEKVVLPAEVTEAASESVSVRHTVELDFCAKDGEVEFTRTYELGANQKEIVISEVPADGEYAVKGYLYEDGNSAAVHEFDAVLESM